LFSRSHTQNKINYMASNNSPEAAVANCDELLRLIEVATKHHPIIPNDKHKRVSPPPRNFEAIYSRLFAIYENPEFSAFAELLNAIKFNCPHYYQVITKPVAVRTILDNLAEGNYSNPNDVRTDVERIRENCAKFNGPQSEFTSIAIRLTEKFDRELKLATQEELSRFSFLVDNSTPEAMERAFHAIKTEVPNLVTGDSVDLDNIHSGLVQQVIKMLEDSAK
jgi:hypothetical protein